MGDETNITYETLFELLRREKGREELQKLDETFFSDVVSYLKDKHEMLKKKDSVFSESEHEKLLKQVENAKKIIKKLYDKREKKISHLAIYKAKTNSDLIDKSLFLKEEKEMFDALVYVLRRFRKGVLGKVLNLSDISGVKENNKEDIQEKKEEEKEIKEEEEKTKLVKFLNPIPKFIGEELESYGPFEEKDIANLPKGIAEVLIRKGRAEEIKQ